MLPRNNVLVLLRNRGCTKDSRQQLCGLKANMTESIRYAQALWDKRTTERDLEDRSRYSRNTAASVLEYNNHLHCAITELTT